MSIKKRCVASLMIFILMMLIFAFTAGIEYNRSYNNQVKETQDKLLFVKQNLENLIASRMIAINGLKVHVEIHPDFNQNEFTYFAEGIYESADDVVQSMSFLTDTTITHIYPYKDYGSILGTDLSLHEEQKAWIHYAKDKLKPIITAPVNLVEGGVGIIVRIPVLRQDKYFGQVSIVFEYDKTLMASGLIDLGENYYVELIKTNEFSQDESIIWTNINSGMMNQEAAVSTRINLYESQMLLYATPKEGFDGKSKLFILILAVGLLVAGISSFMLYKLLTITMALGHSKIELKENNEELKVMVNKLRLNEDKLYFQYNEINEQKEHIEVLADSDYLTNLFNRRRFKEDINRVIINGKKGTILLFDIDNFKNINDTQGHHYGDKVLCHIGTALKESLLAEASIYRIGGDEFAIHLPQVIESEEIEASIQKFFKVLKVNNCIDQITNHITASVGIARYPLDSSSADELLMKSDIAMYQAKKEGKNRFCYFTKELIAILDYNVKVEKDLRNAFEQQQFKLVYQPIVNSQSGEVESLEALIRIIDSTLSPSEFIPIAETSGLIVPIGHWIIEQVCNLLKEWQENIQCIKPISINISAKQLHDDSIIDYIQNTLQRYNISPNLLEIEITESVLIENSDYTINLLRKIRELGIKISLDDFGTGYSSLSYLTYMPVDKVKIDKSLKEKFLFLHDSVVMEGIFSICHGLEMKVVTEGVETKEEFELLRKYGSDFIQGYYFEKPLSEEEVVKRLNKNYLENL